MEQHLMIQEIRETASVLERLAEQEGPHVRQIGRIVR